MSISGGPLDPGDLIGLAGSGGPRSRRSRRRVPPGEAVRSTLIALVSTVVFFGLIVVIVANAPNWPEVQHAFFDGAIFARSLPKLVEAFGTNIALFLIAEVFILALGLVLAVLRGLPGPVFFPVRLLATVYVDLFRAVPGILVIYLLGFGIPGLGNALVHAIQTGDAAMTNALVYLGAIFYVAGLILTDICYAFADPRIRLS